MACRKGVFDYPYRFQVFKFSTHKSRTLPRFYMLKLHDGKEVIVVFNTKTISEI